MGRGEGEVIMGERELLGDRGSEDPRAELGWDTRG